MRYQPIHAKIYAFLLLEISRVVLRTPYGRRTSATVICYTVTRVHDIVLGSDRTALFRQDYRHSEFRTIFQRTIFQNGQEKILKCKHLCLPCSSRQLTNTISNSFD